MAKSTFGKYRVTPASGLDDGSLSILDESMGGSQVEDADQIYILGQGGRAGEGRRGDWKDSPGNGSFRDDINDEDTLSGSQSQHSLSSNRYGDGGDGAAISYEDGGRLDTTTLTLDREATRNYGNGEFIDEANRDRRSEISRSGLGSEDSSLAPDSNELDTRSFRKEAKTQLVGGFSIEKTLLTQFGTKTSLTSRDDDNSSVGASMAKLSVGEGFFRQSNFQNVTEEEMLRMNAWNAFMRFSTTQGELVMDGGSRGLPIAILIESLKRVGTNSMSEKDLVAIIAKQQYPSKAMLSWREFHGLVMEIYHLNRGNFHVQGSFGGTAIRSEKLSRAGSADVQRPSKMGLSTPNLKHQPQARHRPTEAENVMSYHASHHGPRTHDYHMEAMGFRGGVFDESTASMNTAEGFHNTMGKHKAELNAHERMTRRQNDPGDVAYLGGSQTSLDSLNTGSPSKMRRSLTGDISDDSFGKRILVPKMKQTAFQLLLQKQRGASSVKMAQLPPGAAADIGTSHAFVDIDINGTAGMSAAGGKVKISTNKINNLMLTKLQLENKLKREQIQEMKELYPIKNAEMLKADSINRLTQPLLKHKVYTMTHRDEGQLAMWKRMKDKRDERQAREVKKETRKGALSFIANLVGSGQKDSLKQQKRDLSTSASFEKLMRVAQLKEEENVVQQNIRKQLEDISMDKKESAASLRVAINSSIELTHSILEDEVTQRKFAVKERLGEFKLNPSSSALLRVPDVYLERIKKARSLEQYEQAKADEKAYLEETMDMRIKNFASSKHERLMRVAENTVKIDYGSAVDVDRQARIFHNDNMLDPRTGAYIYDGIEEGSNSNHRNSHKHGAGLGGSNRNGNGNDDYTFNDSSLLGSTSDFLHVITPNYCKYSAGGSIVTAGLGNIGPSLPGSQSPSNVPSRHLTPSTLGATPGGVTNSRAHTPGKAKISRADGKDLRPGGRSSVPTSTPEIRKQPFKDKSDQHMSPHGKNVYPQPKPISTGLEALNVNDALQHPPDSPPQFKLDRRSLSRTGSPGSPSDSLNEESFMRDMALSEYQEHMSRINDSPRHHIPSLESSPANSVGSHGSHGSGHGPLSPGAWQPILTAPLATLTDDSVQLNLTPLRTQEEGGSAMYDVSPLQSPNAEISAELSVISSEA